MDLTNAKLIVLDGPKVGQQYPFDTLPLTIGRTSEADFVIPDASISRKHAEIRMTPTGVSIRDVGSKNGIEVNSRPARGGVELYDGDKITIGQVKLKCVMPHHLRPAPPKPSTEKEASRTSVDTDSPQEKQDHSNIILATILGFGVILAVLALVLVSDDSQAPPRIQTLAVGQELLVATNYNLNKVEIDVENQRVVRVRPDKRLVNVLWLKGGGVGDSLVNLIDKKGEILVSYKAIVRGRYHDLENELGLMDLDAEDRVRLAKKYEREAESVRRDSLLDALYAYEKALAAVRDVPEQEEYYLALQKKKEAVDAEFEKTYKAIGQEYLMARSNENIEGMYAALRKIKELVPDQTHPYYQRAKYYYNRLQARNKR